MNLGQDEPRLAVTLKRISTNTAIFFNTSVKNESGNVLFHSKEPLSPVEALMVILTDYFGVHGVQVQLEEGGELLSKDDLRRLAKCQSSQP